MFSVRGCWGTLRTTSARCEESMLVITCSVSDGMTERRLKASVTLVGHVFSYGQVNQ